MHDCQIVYIKNRLGHLFVYSVYISLPPRYSCTVDPSIVDTIVETPIQPCLFVHLVCTVDPSIADTIAETPMQLCLFVHLVCIDVKMGQHNKTI